MLLMLTFWCCSEGGGTGATQVQVYSPRSTRSWAIDWVRRISQERNQLSNNTMQKDTQEKKGTMQWGEREGGGGKGKGKGWVNVSLAVPSVVGVGGI